MSCENCSNYECVYKTNGRARIGITEDLEIFVVTDDGIIRIETKDLFWEVDSKTFDLPDDYPWKD